MAGFERISGADRGTFEFAISGITVVKGDAMDWDRSNAVVGLATSSSSLEDLAGVAAESATTSDTVLLMQKITEDDEYVVDTNANSDATHNGQRQILTDENTVNNQGSDQTGDTAVFLQLGIVGAVGDKKIRGKFITRMDSST